MKYLIVGLGNIGSEYQDTRHNIGFNVLDAFAKASNIVFEDMRHGAVGEAKIRGNAAVFLKPNTYMNLSGKAVSYWMQKEKIGLEQLLIIVDDLALPFGTIRLRGQGSDGGHNGLKNINDTLGTNNYARLRFGIGDTFSKGKQIDYVLGKWDENENAKLPTLQDFCSEIINSFVLTGITTTMNKFNGKNIITQEV